MRSTSGAILVGVGTFLIVGAVATPLVVAPALVKVPLDQSSVTVSTAQNATVLDFGTLSERSGVNLTAHRAVRGDVKDGNADRAVFNVGVRVIDDADKEITLSTDRVALDRRTAMAVACCAEDINGAPFKHEGLTYTFPFGTEKKTYQYFDNTARKAYPAKYVSTEKLQGLTVYKFEMTVEPIQISEIKVPGSLLGSTEQVVNAGRYYANTRTLWVEPDSGVIVKGQEKQLQTLRDGTGADKIKIIDADLAFTEDTQKQQAKAAKDARGQINLLTTVVPVILGLLGLALVLIGVYLVVRAGRRRPEAALVETDDRPTTDLPSQRSPEPAAESPESAGGRHAAERTEP
ncbi:DUF3068 domain-containing protein [Micromonospora taraxaci]|uniref:DUF3068 domain-containing protein n=1 Tax=Micromonospora taraxaci TaxID=1316803 RepID=UPI0033EE69AF